MGELINTIESVGKMLERQDELRQALADLVAAAEPFNLYPEYHDDEDYRRFVLRNNCGDDCGEYTMEKEFKPLAAAVERAKAITEGETG